MKLQKIYCPGHTFVDSSIAVFSFRVAYTQFRMKAIQAKKQDKDKKTIDTAVARVSGAVQVAGIAVSATMAIKDEALDEVAAIQKKSNTRVGNNAIKHISANTKRVLGKSK